MKKIGNWLATNWYPIVLFSASAAILALFLFFHLGSLVSGFNDQELVSRSASSSYAAILRDPLNAPHKILQLSAQVFGQNNPFAMRTASVIIAMIIVGSFYFIMTNWYSRRVAALTTILFASSAWFLSVARSGTDIIMYSALISLVACVIWLQKSKGSKYAVIFSAITVLTLLYVPGMIWFVIPVIVWQYGRIGSLLEGQNVATLSIITLLAVIALAPLGWAFYQDSEVIKSFFGLPATFPELKEIAINVGQIPVQLFYRGPDIPGLWLGRLPLLSWFSTIMFIIGVYAYFFKRKLDRTWFIYYVLIIGTVLVGLGGPVNISILLPFIYILIAGGMALLLQQWFTIFPKNPVAMTLGALLMSLAVITTTYYNINQYYIAWPNSPETKSAHQKF